MITIKLTQHHIDRGVRLSRFDCPISLALGDLGFSEILVDVDFIWFDGWSHKTPTMVAEWIIAFDAGKEVRPFEFEL